MDAPTRNDSKWIRVIEATRAKSWTGPLGLLCSVLVFAFSVRFYLGFPSTVEDSFILFRYAKHVALGEGLTWNPGLPRDQGMTGVAWATLVGAVLRAVGGDIPRVAGYLGIVTGSCTLAVFYLALRRFLEHRSPFFPLVGVAALAFSPYFQRHAASGMETVLTFFVCALTVYLAVSLPTRGMFAAIGATGTLSFLSFLIRPDAPLFCLAVLVPFVYWNSANNRSRNAALALFTGLAAVGVAAFLLGKYFSTVLPLPVYLKLSFFELVRHPAALRMIVPPVLKFQTEFFTAASIWIACCLFTLLGYPKSLDISVKALIVGTITFYLYLFTVVPIMNFDMRYQSILLVPTVFVGTVSLAELTGGLRSQQRSPARKLQLEALCLTCVFSQIGVADTLKSETIEGKVDHEIFKPLGQQLSTIRGLKLASSEAGVLAFYSDGRFLDLIGLNNTFVALNRRDPRYATLLDRYMATTFGYPDLYVRKIVYVDPYADLCTMPEIISRYDFAGEVNGAGSPGLFLLRDSPASPRIRHIIENLGMQTALRPNHPAPLTAAEGCAAAQVEKNVNASLN